MLKFGNLVKNAFFNVMLYLVSNLTNAIFVLNLTQSITNAKKLAYEFDNDWLLFSTFDKKVMMTQFYIIKYYLLLKINHSPPTNINTKSSQSLLLVMIFIFNEFYFVKNNEIP